jgi:hypothetical protein
VFALSATLLSAALIRRRSVAVTFQAVSGKRGFSVRVR